MQVLKCVRRKLESAWVDQEVSRITEILVRNSSPEAVYLFGSAAEKKMTDQSDFDFLVVLKSESEIKEAQKRLRSYFPLSKYPVDIIWKTKEEFETKKEVGGVCFVAFHDGNHVFQKGILDSD